MDRLLSDENPVMLIPSLGELEDREEDLFEVSHSQDIGEDTLGLYEQIRMERALNTYYIEYRCSGSRLVPVRREYKLLNEIGVD